MLFIFDTLLTQKFYYISLKISTGSKVQVQPVDRFLIVSHHIPRTVIQEQKGK
uniref:Uncharacterized protein n=1 Tax=Rhizophora mucronata TaxID=61149 RepID=A0A2P2PS64_RHIMU